MPIDDLLTAIRLRFEAIETELAQTKATLDGCNTLLSKAEATIAELTKQVSLAEVVPLVSGLAGRNTPRRDVGIYHVRARWRDLEPEPGVFVEPNAITDAMASGLLFRVRLDCGRYAPDWVKTRVGSVTLYEPQGGETDTVPRWWTSEYRSYYERLLSWLASRYDGAIPALFGGGAMTFYNEPCLRQLSHGPNRNALRAAGYTWQADIEAQEAFISVQHEKFKRTRLAYSFNPYQRLNADGTFVTDTGLTRRLAEAVRAKPTAIVQNNSLRTPLQTSGGYAEMYQMLKELGHPLSFQTAAINRVGDLDATVDTAISWGAHLVELPDGGTCSDLVRRDAALRKNALR